MAAKQIPCDHCGEDCIDEVIPLDDKNFCCTGCKTVYEILSENDLCDYYEIDSPGITVKSTEFGNKYAFLDHAEIREKLYSFQEGNYRIVTFFVPVIHCASCIWLLENLNRLLLGVQSSKVNFIKKEVTIHFNEENLSLRKIVETLASIGYPPTINLQEAKDDKLKKQSRNLLIKMGVAGFCFGNIMLMSFPEYLSFRFQDEAFYIKVFAWLNLALSIPVVMYCARDYFTSAWKGLRYMHINIDVPISLGMLVLFLRSSYDIVFDLGPGYLDSLAGLVFFLLIGKWFQSKTYEALSFERDYKSYFPLAVTLIENNTERSILANQLKKSDEILIRNEELIPADSILIDDKAEIDYSFVTGESDPVAKQKGDFIYAGGRLKGRACRLIVQEKVSQSYLTDLWNQAVFSKDEQSQYSSVIDKVSQYFTLAIISIALGAFVFWSFKDTSLAAETFTAVLIIACPCALALSLPFTLGNSIRILGSNGLFLKNSITIENLSRVDTLVFDKTGTITSNDSSTCLFHGEQRLSPEQEHAVAALCRQSTHPISKAIAQNLKPKPNTELKNYREVPGLGIEGQINDLSIKIGSGKFCNTQEVVNGSHAFVSINSQVVGYFLLTGNTRNGFATLIEQFKTNGFDLHLISGDTGANQQYVTQYFNSSDQVRFEQSPQQKLEYIEALIHKNKQILMLGDGLNDAGALKAAQVGLAVSEDVYSFSPACDGILSATHFQNLASYIQFTKSSMKIVRWSFVLSFLYNGIGLFYAVQGLLTPIVAAILMPLSSITIVVFVSTATSVVGKKMFSKTN